MKKILVFPIFAVLAFAISISVPEVYASPSITLTSSGTAGGSITVSGSGFTGLHVYLFLDGVLKDTVPVDSGGSIFITIPAAPGSHTILLSSDPTNPLGTQLVSGTITVPSPSIPEFPFSFNLIIIFVAVTAVYLAIRQKMSANLKPF